MAQAAFSAAEDAATISRALPRDPVLIAVPAATSDSVPPFRTDLCTEL